MSKVYFPKNHTPEEWRAMGRSGRQEAYDSFDRCDTDGFLSQWANNTMAALYDFCAELAEADGMWEFAKLADTDGNLVEGAKEVQTRYGWSWVIDTPEGAKWFNPSKAKDDAKREAANLRKGYRIVRVKRPAGVVLNGNGISCQPVAIELRH